MKEDEEPKEAKEMIADIVKDIRLYVDDCNNGMAYRAFPLDELADRIDAAWKRESKAIATENAVLPAVCITKSVGNAAALREYAKRLVDAVKDADLCDFIYGSDFCKSCQFIHMCKAARDCESAISAPPRNCERFETREDAQDAFEAQYRESDKEVLKRYPLATLDAFCDWIFATATGQKGEPYESK